MIVKHIKILFIFVLICPIYANAMHLKLNSEQYVPDEANRQESPRIIQTIKQNCCMRYFKRNSITLLLVGLILSTAGYLLYKKLYEPLYAKLDIVTNFVDGIDQMIPKLDISGHNPNLNCSEGVDAFLEALKRISKYCFSKNIN